MNPVNLPLFANGTGAFLGDYIDVAGPIIVATTDATAPYKFNVGHAVGGITELSQTRKPSMPRTLSCGSTTESASPPMRQVPTG